jgi:hypothetical protein
MSDVTFTLSLRVTHPTMRHEVISDSISMRPRIASNVGEPRENPAGRLLGGIHKATFCTFDMIEKQAGFFTDGVDQVLTQLARHREFLVSLFETGGRSELYIGVFSDANSTGFTMEPNLMAAIADLRLQLSVEFYLG